MKKILLLCLFLFGCDEETEPNPEICVGAHYNWGADIQPDFDDDTDIDWFQCYQIDAVGCANKYNGDRLASKYYYFGDNYESCQDWCNQNDKLTIDEEEYSNHWYPENNRSSCEIY